MKRIGDITVSDELYYKAKSVRRDGGKVFITIPENLTTFEAKLFEEMGRSPSQFCANCNGAGNIGLQIIVGGPFPHTPPTSNKTNRVHTNDPDNPGPRATWIDGNWYLQKTRPYQCPICKGTGAYIKPVKKEMAL